MLYNVVLISAVPLTSLLLLNLNEKKNLKWPIETNSSETVLPPLIKTGVAGIGDNIHLASELSGKTW